MVDKNGEEIFRIPDNVLKSKRYLGFKRRNITEAIISFIISAFLIYQISFVMRVKIIFIICVGASVAFINLIGIKNQSISEIILNFIKYKKQKPVLHLRSVKYAKSKKTTVNKKGEFITTLNESIAEKYIRLAKEKFEEYKENKK